VVPGASEQDYIHDKYMNELVHDILLPTTRQGMLAIVERLRAEEHIEGLILGGTELPLLLGDVKDAGIPFLDTTRLHVEQIVTRMLT
jgi:aspartate racemase